MDKRNFVTEKIIDSMKNIFAFSRARVSNATEAEDLSQQIIVELLASADTLKDEDAFYGWLWAVARNTYGKYIRTGKKECLRTGEIDVHISDLKMNIEDDFVMKEDINILRREMSLLTRQYREAVVKYYIEEKSCVQISKELSVTVETVKHLLFKARKILKEGINMNREFGEKSYNPGAFTFSSYKINGSDTEYLKIFTGRKLPGNILLSAYYSPLTAAEMSVELGVAAAYLEDEIQILLDNGLIKLMQNGRYQTNLFIYTSACTEDIEMKTKKMYDQIGNKISTFIDANTDKIKEIAFNGENIPQNNLRWLMCHFLLCEWAIHSIKEMILDSFPPLPHGGTGYLYGFNENQENLNKKQRFYGAGININSKKYDGGIYYTNYRILENCQPRIPQDISDDFLLAAAHKSFNDFEPDVLAEHIRNRVIEKENDVSYKSLVPSISKESAKKLYELASDLWKDISMILEEIGEAIAQVMENHAPQALREQARGLAKTVNYMNHEVGSDIIGNLCESGYLIIPTTHNFLTIYTVI